MVKPNKNIPVLQLRINNANIDEVQNLNFLGLQVSSDITWNLHINEISKKISRIIGILKKLKLIVPKNVLLTISQLQQKALERSPVQDTFLILNHYLHSTIF